jgi:hypothetical protein
VPAHILQIVSAQKGLFSQSITYIPGYTSSNYPRDHRSLPRSNCCAMGGVDDDQQFKHTPPPAYASAMIRFISLNLSVSRV